MNRSLIVALLFLFPLLLHAQPTVIMAPGFDEPEAGTKKLLLLKNGNTAYVNITNDAIEVKMYNKEGKAAGGRNIPHSMWTERKMSASHFKGIYEINNEIVLFYEQIRRGNTLGLHRIHLDAATGKFNKAKQILDLGESSAMFPTYLYVDEVTHSQVVMYHHDFKAKEITAQFYNDKFDSTKKVVLTTQDSIMEYHAGELRNNVLTVFYSYTMLKSKEKSLGLMAGVVKDGSNAFDIYNLNANIASGGWSKLTYNAATNIYQLITKAVDERKHGYSKTTVYYSTGQQFIDMGIHSVIAEKGMGGELDTKARDMGLKDGYSGIFDDIQMNADNTTSLISEEVSYYMVRNITETRAGNIGVVVQDAKGNVAGTYVIKRRQASGRGFMRNPFEIE